MNDADRTLPDTTDRIAATSMDATWTWSRPPADFTKANGRLLATSIAAFLPTDEPHGQIEATIGRTA